MTFTSLETTTNDIRLIFSTVLKDALLVYTYGQQTGGRSDFVAVEIRSGRVTFSYGGVRTEITRVTVPVDVSNGHWFRLTATRNGRVASLAVTRCQNGGEECGECAPEDSSCYDHATGLSG